MISCQHAYSHKKLKQNLEKQNLYKTQKVYRSDHKDDSCEVSWNRVFMFIHCSDAKEQKFEFPLGRFSLRLPSKKKVFLQVTSWYVPIHLKYGPNTINVIDATRLANTKRLFLSMLCEENLEMFWRSRFNLVKRVCCMILIQISS